MALTQKIIDKTFNNKKTQLGVGFGGEPESKKKLTPSMGKVPMRNDAQATGSYPKANALAKAKLK